MIYVSTTGTSERVEDWVAAWVKFFVDGRIMGESKARCQVKFESLEVRKLDENLMAIGNLDSSNKTCFDTNSLLYKVQDSNRHFDVLNNKEIHKV